MDQYMMTPRSWQCWIIVYQSNNMIYDALSMCSCIILISITIWLIYILCHHVLYVIMYYRTRHVKIRYFFVNQFLENGEMKIKYCPTESMVADILTKPIVGSQFKMLARQLLGYERPFSWIEKIALSRGVMEIGIWKSKIFMCFYMLYMYRRRK